MRTSLFILVFAIPAAFLGQERGGFPIPSPGNVTLPLDEYNKLVDLAAKPAGKSDAPLLPYAIKSADLKIRITGESASESIQLEGEVFSTGPIKVPLITGMTVLDAQQKGQELPLQQEGGVHTAVFPGPAEFSVTLDARLPLSIEAGRASFNLPAPPAGTVRLMLEIPGDHTNVNIKPGLITGRTSNNGRTTIEATLDPGQPAAIWWATRESAAPAVARPVRFLSEMKTLISVNDAQLALAALADITVVEGEPSQFELDIPAGYEVTGAAGASLDSSEAQSGVLILKTSSAALRSHQFLISMEKSIGASKTDVPLLTFKGAQRETGEVLIEGGGTMELTATESGGLKRMDLKETSPYLRALAHNPIQSAFRYHRQPAETPALSLEWVRFPDSGVLAAVAQQAVVTTLVTSEGRSLTEVKLTLSNQAQPFLKVGLPAGATIVSADVGGEKVKPVQGADGNRVPLLRPGFRPTGSYPVSFVFMHSGAPFSKKGDSELALPGMDLPIGLLEWEVFLPEQYKVKDFGGDAITASLLPPGAPEAAVDEERASSGQTSTFSGNVRLDSLLPGQLGGLVVDPAGAAVSRPRVSVVHSATGAAMTADTDMSGHWIVSNVPSGRVTITFESPGYQRLTREVNYDAGRPSRVNATLHVGSVSETVTVSASELPLNTRQIEAQSRKSAAAADTAASSNVLNLQRRVAGVLPIAVDVPRAGRSFRFVRPLVIDEETKVTFRYRTK